MPDGGIEVNTFSAHLVRRPSWHICGKTALIIGATTPVGRCVAMELAQNGARIILATNETQAAEDLAYNIRWELGLGNGDNGHYMVSWRYVDLASMESVRQLARKINEKETQLHILVNAASTTFPKSKSRQVTADGKFELTFATHCLSPFLLTNLLLGLLKRSTPSRVIVAASACYKMCKKAGGYNIADPQYSANPGAYRASMAYCQSQLANILFAQRLQSKLLYNCGVSVYIADPSILGMVGTMALHQLTTKAQRRKGAQSIAFCCIEANLQAPANSYFKNCKPRELDEIALDEKTAEQLWTMSETLLASIAVEP